MSMAALVVSGPTLVEDPVEADDEEAGEKELAVEWPEEGALAGF
jgi:hypothetical protein